MKGKKNYVAVSLWSPKSRQFPFLHQLRRESMQEQKNAAFFAGCDGLIVCLPS